MITPIGTQLDNAQLDNAQYNAQLDSSQQDYVKLVKLNLKRRTCNTKVVKKLLTLEI